MKKRMTRSRDDRMIAGVCGGLADYFGADPTIVRLAFVALTVLGIDTTVLVYLAAWIIVPLDDGWRPNHDVQQPPSW